MGLPYNIPPLTPFFLPRQRNLKIMFKIKFEWAYWIDAYLILENQRRKTNRGDVVIRTNYN